MCSSVRCSARSVGGIPINITLHIEFGSDTLTALPRRFEISVHLPKHRAVIEATAGVFKLDVEDAQFRYYQRIG
jgi:hypothetical protein